jgi:hypothetical protein
MNAAAMAKCLMERAVEVHIHKVQIKNPQTHH